MRASSAVGPRATITSLLAASQHEAEMAGAEHESGSRKTPCAMLRKFRISTDRSLPGFSASRLLLAERVKSYQKQLLFSGIAGGVCGLDRICCRRGKKWRKWNEG